MKKRNIILIVVGALILAVSIFGIVSAKQRGQAANSTLQTTQIQRGDISAVVDETGEVHTDQSATLYWETTGIVGSVNVVLGEKVEADQVLADLKENSLPQSYYLSQQELVNATRALEDLYESAAETAANAQAAVANARDALDDAEYHWLLNQPGNRYSDEELKSAKAKVVVAEARMANKRKRVEHADGKVARAQAQILYTDAINQYQYAVWYVNWLLSGADEIEMAILDANVAVAKANLEAAEREYEKVKDGPDPDNVTMAEARVAAAQAALDTAVVTAPFDGTITAVEAIPGNLVAPNSTAFRMDNMDKLIVDVGVSEVDIIQIEAGQPAKLTFDAILGKEYQGVVSEVSPVGIQKLAWSLLW
jgi:HlyD family secretion protein